MINIQTDITSGIIAATDSIPTVKEELSGLRSLPFDDLINTLMTTMVHFAISMAVAIAVFYIGKFIIRKLYNMVAGIMIKRSVDRSLSTFVLSLIRIVLYFILIVTVISILGINTSSFIALFASAGVAVGMALSGTLQNFAGGVLILLLKPYKIGDYIEAQGFSGTVTEIQIFSTIISTPDNKSIIIPNGGLSTGTINNWSREDYRRVEWNIGISYGDNIDTARNTILAMFETDSRIVKHTIEQDRELHNTPAPEDEQNIQPEKKRKGLFRRIFTSRRESLKEHIGRLREPDDTHIRAFVPQVDRSPSVNLASLGDSAVTLCVRAWVRSSDYWSVFYQFNERFYTELPAAGISFPFPQLDVHVTRPES